MMNSSRAFKDGIKMSKSAPQSPLLRMQHLEGKALHRIPGAFTDTRHTRHLPPDVPVHATLRHDAGDALVCV